MLIFKAIISLKFTDKLKKIQSVLNFTNFALSLKNAIDVEDPEFNPFCRQIYN